MSHINQALILAYIKQLGLVAEHQALASKNMPNQLVNMLDGLNSLTSALGEGNEYGITSVTEETINITIERTKLQTELNQ